MPALAITLTGILSLAGCSPRSLGDAIQSAGSSASGSDANRSASRVLMSDREASADCLSQVEGLIRDSDAGGLAAAFSDEARSADPDLQSRAEELMALVGGGAMGDQEFYMSAGGNAYSRTLIMSRATVTATDGSKWQMMVTDCTQDKENPSRVGIREVQVIPNTDWDAPKGFGWDNSDLSDRMGIRLIRTWDGWDPSTNMQL